MWFLEMRSRIQDEPIRKYVRMLVATLGNEIMCVSCALRMSCDVGKKKQIYKKTVQQHWINGKTASRTALQGVGWFHPGGGIYQGH